jgi:aspartyl-tRNA(Asn)/glutamyl-tRNA(Gln) amidotransferase subunit A
MADLADLSAVELLARYRARSLSPVEVLDAVASRIAACEPKLQALYLYRPEAAREAALQSERRWREDAALPLDGVPVTIKENIATKGDPCRLARPRASSRSPRPMPRPRPACAKPAR